MPYYTPWAWSPSHRRHYSYLMDDSGVTIQDTLWSGPSGGPPENSPSTPQNPGLLPDPTPATQGPNESDPATPPGQGDQPGTEGERVDSPHNLRFPLLSQRSGIDALPPDVQANIGYKDRRFIQTGADNNVGEQLDSRYRRVSRDHHTFFFVPGRVFKMLWTEPAGQSNPGRTRNSTHFSTVWCGEQAYSEIRRFIVVRNKGTFSQCIPVQTYNRRGATKQGLVMHDHGVIHTTPIAPNLIFGENLTKFSIRVDPTDGEHLEPESRVNYGKAYAVEHNVKVLNIGMVVEDHRYLIEGYFDSAMRGQ